MGKCATLQCVVLAALFFSGVVDSGRVPRSGPLENMDEARDVIRQEIKKNEDVKKVCGNSEFYDYNKQTCELCDDYCKGDNKLPVCGMKCTVYFQNAEYSRQMGLLKFFVGGIGVIAVSCMILGVILWRKHGNLKSETRRISKRLQDIDERNKNRFPADEEPNDPLMGNGNRA